MIRRIGCVVLLLAFLISMGCGGKKDMPKVSEKEKIKSRMKQPSPDDK
jgi:hypothetical protein